MTSKPTTRVSANSTKTRVTRSCLVIAAHLPGSDPVARPAWSCVVRFDVGIEAQLPATSTSRETASIVRLVEYARARSSSSASTRRYPGLRGDHAGGLVDLGPIGGEPGQLRMQPGRTDGTTPAGAAAPRSRPRRRPAPRTECRRTGPGRVPVQVEHPQPDPADLQRERRRPRARRPPSRPARTSAICRPSTADPTAAPDRPAAARRHPGLRPTRIAVPRRSRPAHRWRRPPGPTRRCSAAPSPRRSSADHWRRGTQRLWQRHGVRGR